MYTISALTPNGRNFSVSLTNYVSVVQIYSELIEGHFLDIEILDPDQIYINI